jgi:hypothetical protein
MLDRHPVPLETQVSDQVEKMDRVRQCGKFPRLTVEDEMHTGRVSPAQPPLQASKGRLHLGAGIIDSAVAFLQDLDGCYARVGTPQRPFVRKIRGVLVGKIFDRVAQNFQCAATLR